MKRTISCVAPFLLALMLASVAAFAQPIPAVSAAPLGTQPADSSSVKGKTTDLFLRDTPILFTLSARLQRILRDRTKPSNDSLSTKHPALLTYTDSVAGNLVSLPLTLLVRGNFRRKASNCEFPPLYLDFAKKRVKGTLFAKQNKLKLVTHCQGDEYVVREYLIYKLYNLITPLSFRTRLARVSYVDSLRKRPTETRWSFLIEDDEDMIKRNGLKEVKTGVESESVDSLSLARLTVFEFMIGNIDWSVFYRHNVRLAAKAGSSHPVAVPYDFDHAALVDTPYAPAVDPDNATNLPNRQYRGPLYPGWLLKRVFAEFTALKPQFYALYETDKRLSRTYVAQTHRFLDAFYTLINDPSAVRSHFFNGDTSGVLFSSFR